MFWCAVRFWPGREVGLKEPLEVIKKGILGYDVYKIKKFYYQNILLS